MHNQGIPFGVIRQEKLSRKNKKLSKFDKESKKRKNNSSQYEILHTCFAVDEVCSSYNKDVVPVLMPVEKERRYVPRKERDTYRMILSPAFINNESYMLKSLDLNEVNALRFIMSCISSGKTRIYRGAIADYCGVHEDTVSLITLSLALKGLIAKKYYHKDASEFRLSEYFMCERVRRVLSNWFPQLKYITSFKCIFRNMYSRCTSFFKENNTGPNRRKREQIILDVFKPSELDTYDPILDVHEEVDAVFEF